MDYILTLLHQYGYIIIFIALALEMLALPLPGEMLMSYTGLFVYQGQLSWSLSIAAAGAGLIAGVTSSYWIGLRLGKPFVSKYGSRVHLGEEQLARMSVWFEKYGDKLLFFSFFIPGVRHVTGYFCGVTRMPFRRYAAYAYSGGVFWVGLFISLGTILGPKWEAYHGTVNRYMLIFGAASLLISLLVYIIRKYKSHIVEFTLNLLKRGIEHFQSLGKVRFVVLAAFILFAGFFSLMLGLIQDYFAHEFSQFDEIVTYLVQTTFGPGWHRWMNGCLQLGSFEFYLPVLVLTALWIVARGRNRLLELVFLVWAAGGGELLDEGLRVLFHRHGPNGGGTSLLNTFPSEQTLISMTVCGFSAYLILRHTRSLILRPFVIGAVLAVCLLIGISRIDMQLLFPSDVAAGYVFGGVWLSLNIMLLEIVRELQDNGRMLLGAGKEA
ncbi:VTT domain-containing protein [Paenibacillus sp. JX-17]|uniref:VTT domain-containing protein n=1 Tax=Paenibacillus lacisoli TaxID=3064525 RepID=A0ABT9CDW8_9BACL|nr:VTT domain-containing protein [Paenibacillus sp. JX-17]MDO7907474.1 VTT domain-containing protein [Paenibacillus sp. JX-17]